MPQQIIGSNPDGTPIYGLPLPEHPGILQIVQNLSLISAQLTALTNQVNNLPAGDGGGAAITVIAETKPVGQYATNYPANTWNKRQLNTMHSGISGISNDNGLITVPMGIYWCEWGGMPTPTRHTAWMLSSPSLGINLGRQQYYDLTHINNLDNDLWFKDAMLLEFAAPQTIQLNYSYAWAFSGYEAVAGGIPRGTGQNEQYCWVKLTKL